MLNVIALTSIEPFSETTTALGIRFSLSHDATKNNTAATPINLTHMRREIHTLRRERQPAPVTNRFFGIAKRPPNQHILIVVTTVGGFGIFSLASTPSVESHVTSRTARWNPRPGTTPAPSTFFHAHVGFPYPR
jgi:hypothetical protein